MIRCMTVILGRSDVAALLDIDETIAALDAGFRHDQQVAVPGQRARRRRLWCCAASIRAAATTMRSPCMRRWAWQDLAVAWTVYQKAAITGRGTEVDLLR